MDPEYEVFKYDVDMHTFGDYPSRIPVPMYLQRIALRLLRDYYRCVEALVHDVDLIRVNCATYNDPSADIVHTATQLVEELHHYFRSSKDSIDDHQESDELRRPVRSTRAASAGLIPELVGNSRDEVKQLAPDNLPQAFQRIMDWLSEIDALQMLSEPVVEDLHRDKTPTRLLHYAPGN